MHNDERLRQAARRRRNEDTSTPRDLALKRESDMNKRLRATPDDAHYMVNYDCTCCKQRFMWDMREPLERCPLCNAGAKQKPNKLPSKRMTHKQRRAAIRAAATKGLVIESSCTITLDEEATQKFKGHDDVSSAEVSPEELVYG